MPQAQFYNIQPRTEQTPLEKIVSGYIESRQAQEEGNELERIYKQYQDDGRNIENAYINLQKSRMSPTKKVAATKDLMDIHNYNQDLMKANIAARAKVSKDTRKLTPEEREDRKRRLIEEGFPENEAEEYLDATPGVQQILYRQHNDLKSRGLREGDKKNTSKSPDIVGTGEQPIASELAVEDSFSNEAEPIDENAWPEIPPPPKMTPAEQVKWQNQNQKENNKTLKETREKTNSTRGIGIRLNRLTALSDKIPDGVGRIVINPSTGEPFGVAQMAGIVNKETQDYVKTLNDFLIDAKAYFGSRVTNFDVQSFKSRLPTLLNTASGRRLILKQMQLMNDLQSLHDTTMEDGLKHYGRNASYSDIVSAVDNKVANREKEIIQKINDLDTASENMDRMARNPEKFKNHVLMQDDKGNFKAVPKDNVNKALNMKWRVY